MAQLHLVAGDATRPIGRGPRGIVHVCNDVGRWGAGFSGALSRAFPAAEKTYRSCYQTVGIRLGNVLVVPCGEIVIYNMVAQEGIRRTAHDPPAIRYGVLKNALHAVASDVEYKRSEDFTLHMPRIGCGLAGGRWSKIEPLIRECLVDRGIDTVVYTLPGDTSWKT